MLDSKLSEQAAKQVVESIDWINLDRNANKWFGIRSDKNPTPHFDIIEAIRLTDDILLNYGDFSSSPIPAQGPFELLSSRSLAQLYGKQASGEKINAADTSFSRLSTHQWKELSPVATLKIQPIKFRPGTNLLTAQAKEEILNIHNILSRYSRYRIRIEGHSSTKGDTTLNKRLSSERAEAIRNHLIETYSLNPNRILSLGKGSESPLKKKSEESYRAWLNRLPRVEFHLLEELY